MKVLFLMCALALSSCAGMIGFKQEDPAYRIAPKNPFVTQVLAVYYSPEFLRAREDKKAETELREPNYNRVPEFGYISVRITAPTSDTANGWLFIVQDRNKNEVYREYGRNSAANFQSARLNTGAYLTSYWNLHNIYFEKNEEFPLYLRVVSPLNKSFDIVIERN
jgi:hypothetical protein